MIRTGSWLRPRADAWVLLRGGVLRRWAALAMMLVLAGCQLPETPPEAGAEPVATYRLAAFSDLQGWSEDAVAEVLPALRRSCARLSGLADDVEIGRLGVAGEWKAVCQGLPGESATDAEVRRFVEGAFLPVSVTEQGKPEGLFTGYYEIVLDGARVRGGGYEAPLYGVPGDLLSLDLSEFASDLPKKTLLGRVEGNRFRPYHDRASIQAGALTAEPMVWAKDPAEAFFLEIQGSGVIRFADGTERRIGYAGKNGRPYVALGKVMVERGLLPADRVSAPAIMAWLRAHPAEGKELMRENPSYVFFRWNDGEGPVGAEGVPLTPGRSLAVDRRFVPYGVPLWLEARQDAVDGHDGIDVRRLMVAQDTGGAIRGVVRGDVFWGRGAEAAKQAGYMKARGRYYLLVPRAVAQRFEAGGAGR